MGVYGSLYIVGTDNAVYRRNGGNLTRLDVNDAQSVAAASNGIVWITKSDLTIWKLESDGTWVQPYPGDAGSDLAVGNDGALYIVGTDNDVYRRFGDNLTRLAVNDAQSVAVGIDGTVWITRSDRTIWRLAP